MNRLPKAIQDFVRQQATVPLADVWKPDSDAHYSPYATYWYKAVACLLLSGAFIPRRMPAPT